MSVPPNALPLMDGVLPPIQPELLQPPPAPAQRSYPNVIPTEEEQREIVSICNEFRNNVEQHASSKKDIMRTGYAYSKGKFVGGDLLPLPASNGSEKDAQSQRPQVFIPLTRQQLKTIYSQIKLTMFPNDQDYFRVRAKTAREMEYEDQLTEGLKYVFKEAMISEKLGKSLYNMLWAGPFVAYPTIQDTRTDEWILTDDQDPLTGEATGTSSYEMVTRPGPRLPDVEAWNPLNFYIDPTATDYERAKWFYIENKKGQFFYDSDQYFNQDVLRQEAKRTVEDQKDSNSKATAEIDDRQSIFMDVEDNFVYALYYFPVLTTQKKEYRNMIVGICNNNTMVRFRPNLFPKGLNPLVFTDYMPEPENPYSTSPAQELMDLQKIINIMWNYKLEVLARAGNRFVANPRVDTSGLFGVAGGVAYAENPKEDIVSLSGDYSEIAALDNSIGVLKAEAQLVSGSQNPFQGSSNVDYQKTATELTILQENSISIMREVIEHVSVTGVQRVLQRLMYLVAELYPEPIEIPIENRLTGQRQFITVDFRLLKSEGFTIELVSTNPSQSKQAQINALMQLTELAATNPQALEVASPVLEKIGDLQGIKNIRELIQQVKDKAYGLQQQAIQQAGLGLVQPPGMEGVPAPPPGGQGAAPPMQA